MLGPDAINGLGPDAMRCTEESPPMVWGVRKLQHRVALRFPSSVGGPNPHRCLFLFRLKERIEYLLIDMVLLAPRTPPKASGSEVRAAPTPGSPFPLSLLCSWTLVGQREFLDVRGTQLRSPQGCVTLPVALVLDAVTPR